jgi:hypothetical protein
MGQFDYALRQPPPHPLGARVRPKGAPSRAHDPLTEWTARPLGRLGTALVAEIETYLEFFAIVHDDARPGSCAGVSKSS